MDRAFAHMVEEFEMPRALPEALIEGLVWDAMGKKYETFDDLARLFCACCVSCGCDDVRDYARA